MRHYKHAVESSTIPAYRKNANALARWKGIAQFGLAARSKEAQAMLAGMAGDVRRYVEAIDNTVPVKLGGVDGSKLFDPNSVADLANAENRQRRVVMYHGEGTHAHATSNNLRSHALMAMHGFGVL
jgi:hypothetical protein